MAEKAKAPVCVAFSGGVDSSLILKLACDTAKKTGMPVYAVTFHTMLHPACDLEIAERVANELGAIHKIIQVNEMELGSHPDKSGQPLLYLQTPPVRDTSGFCKRRGDSVRDGRNQ